MKPVNIKLLPAAAVLLSALVLTGLSGCGRSGPKKNGAQTSDVTSRQAVTAVTTTALTTVHVHEPSPIPGVAPTCETNGIGPGSSCSLCGAILEGCETIPALGHDFERRVCRHCGLDLGVSEGFDCAFDPSGETAIITGLGTCTDRQIEIPEKIGTATVTAIGKGAFSGHTEIESIELPDTVTLIDSEAFYGLLGLNYVRMPADLEEIGASAFFSCSALKRIELPANLKKIGESAFYGCSGLEALHIPAKIEEIGERAFSYCQGLDGITADPGNPAYVSSGNCLVDTSSGILIVGCRKSVIPSDANVRAIGDFAFIGCPLPAALSLPDTIEYIGEYAFMNCVSVRELILPAALTDLADNAFYGCTGLEKIVLPKSLGLLNTAAFSGCISISALEVSPENEILYAKNNCVINRESKTLVFGCRNSVIPDDGSVLNVGDRAFEYCIGLTSVRIPDGIETIGVSAFYYCTSLTEIHIPASVSSIGTGAFAFCPGITSITADPLNLYYFSSGNCLIEKSSGTLISGCNESVIPNDGSVAAIGNLAFVNCQKLESVTIPSGVREIGMAAFSQCSGIKHLDLPLSVQIMDYLSFSKCSSLESINYEGNVSDWENIIKGEGWNADTGNYRLTCSK